MRRLLLSTIWAPGAIPPSEGKYAKPLKRVALPAYDIVAVITGFFAVSSGIPAVDRVLPSHISDLFGYLFVAVALACLVGISFPRLYLLETWAKCFLFGFLGTYAIALRIVAGSSGESTRDFVTGIVLLAMITPLFRLWILGTEARDRKNGKVAA